MQQKNWIKLNNEINIRDKNGDFQLEKDKEAVKSYFLEHINKKTQFFYSLKEKVDYLIENDYYIDFYEYYSFRDIKKVFQSVYEKKFRFSSYMAASKFYSGYALKDNTGDLYLERYEDRIAATALFLAKDEVDPVDKALDYAHLMISQEYQPATPTFLNSGKKRAGQLVSCFLDEIGDSLAGIDYAQGSAMFLSSIGGGVAFNGSKIRSRGEAIKGVDGRASGILPVMKIFEDTFSYANQLGQRPGAGAVYLDIFHQDIVEFLDSKKINVDEKVRIKSLSLGVIIPDKFMQLAEEDSHYYVFGPHSVYQEYGEYLDELDMCEMYDKLVQNPKIRKTKLNAREMLVKIAVTQKESGYPYIFYRDNTNKVHPLNNLGKVKFSNLCTEILQISEVSDVEHRSEESNYKYGISCNLGSLNIVPVMENKSIERTVKDATRMLTVVADNTDIKEVPSISKANEAFKSIGLGAMNLHGFLAKNNIMYDSIEARQFANIFFMMVNYHSITESCDLAIERGKTFRGFEGSTYQTGEYFETYTNCDYAKEYFEVIPKIKTLFEGMSIPTQEDWKELANKVSKFGLYNAYRLAIAPNQSTSYIMSATASVMPIVDQIETRDYGNSSTFYPMPYLTNDNYFYFKSAYDMNQFDVLKMMAVIQKHIDQGISCILHTNSSDTTRDLAKMYIFAHKLGLKTLYYTRTRKSSIEECISCAA